MQFINIFYKIARLITSHSKNNAIRNIQDKKDEELLLLKLKYEKLHYIEETEKERNKTIETKASMFIGSTSIIGAILIGCSKLVTDGTETNSYVNLCIMLFLVILLYHLGRSIVYSILVLKKRNTYALGIDDLIAGSIKEHYTKIISSTIRIIKYNEDIINEKVDLMQLAQKSFIDFLLWSGIYVINIFAYNIFHSYNITMSINVPMIIFMTLLLSIIGYLVLSFLQDKYIKEKKEALDDVKKLIKEVLDNSFNSTDDTEL